MRTLYPSIYSISLALLIFSGCVYSENAPLPINIEKPALEKVRVQLKWFHQFQFAGYYAAIEQGYYQEEGLDVELLERQLDKSVVEQVIQGQAEYGVGDSGLIHEYALGKPIVALAAIFQHNPLVFMTLQNSGIISPYEMRGRRIMMDEVNVNESPLKALLAEVNLTNKDFTLVKQSNDNNALIRGELDVMTGYLTDQPFYYKEMGTKINIINPQNYGVDFYGDILFTSETESQQHPQRLERFLRASLKGWHYALEHPEQMINLIINHYHSKLSLAHLHFEEQELRKLIPDTVPLGTIEQARLKVLADTYEKVSYNETLNEAQLAHFVYQPIGKRLNLTESEFIWLSTHTRIRVAIHPNYHPYEWVNENGEFLGIAADYLKLIEEQLGVHFEFVKTSSWSESLEMAKRGEVDLLVSPEKSLDESNYLDFVTPYYSSPVVIVDNGRANFTDNINKLSGKTVVVEEGLFVNELIDKTQVNLKILKSVDTLSALRLVENGSADVYIGDAYAANYWIKKQELFNLRFSGQIDYRNQHWLAISKHVPQLMPIIQTAVAGIKAKQVDDIVDRWQSLKIEEGISLFTLQKYFVAIALILLLFCGWIIRLNREIKARVQIERREKRRNKVLNMLTNHQTLTSILNAIALDIEEFDSAIACSILLLTDDGKQLQHCAAPRLPDTYCQALDGLEVGPENCICCSSVISGKTAFIKNIHIHPDWQAFREQTKGLPYRACWSQPIYSNDNRLLGTFAIYHQRSKKPSINFVHLLNDAAVLIAMVIEKSKLDTDLQLAASVFTHAREGIYIADKEGCIINCNQAFLNISGYTREELIGQNPRLFKSGEHDKEFYEQMWASLIENDFWSGEISNKYKYQDKTPGLHSISVIRDNNGELVRYLVQTTDISALKLQQQKLEHFAYNDALTGLPNRVLLIDRLKQCLVRNQRHGNSLAIIFIDLDGFKAINDNYGHDVGDAFLKAISQKMQRVIRESDTLARLGGDEFIVILNSLEDSDSYQKPVKKLLEACNSPIDIGGILLRVSASLGISFSTGKVEEPIADPDKLIRQADQAMYVAKKSGKNRYHVFDGAVDQFVNTRQETIGQIQIGIKKDQFLLHYQPKINIRTGALLGVEALIRWQHPQRGLLQPKDFLSVIKNHPVSIELGEWVIKSALGQLSLWNSQNVLIPISVNIDARQLNQHNFIERLKVLLVACPSFKPGGLELEIIETTAIADTEYAYKIISECNALGVLFALDDFGTGYSSITYLRYLPIKTIKIDRSFVCNIDKNPDDLAIVKTLIVLLSSLGRNVIAEGVETLEQGEILLNIGCELVQGFGFAKPMTVVELLKWYNQWSGVVQK